MLGLLSVPEMAVKRLSRCKGMMVLKPGSRRKSFTILASDCLCNFSFFCVLRLLRFL